MGARPPIAHEELAALRAKYEEMLRLRTEEDASVDPRPALARLAARFPGALREIDELPLAEIHRRIGALRAAEAEPALAAPWMRALALFHALMRGALSAKGWLAGRKHVTHETRAAFADSLPALRWADDAAAWVDHLDAVGRPPRGRLSEVVLTRVAGALGVSAGEARVLVFGAARRRRARS